MMIEAGGGNVSILYADGTSAFFDPEELRQRLEKSFAAAGRSDLWIAGEIALAVEYALRCRTADSDVPGMVIRAGDIDDCVVRILEDSGYAAVAGHFREIRVVSGDFGKLSPDAVEPYLAEKLQLSGPAGSELAARIRTAMAAIGAAQCSPHLILELARHFREVDARPQHLPISPVQPEPAAAVEPEPAADPVLQVKLRTAIFPSIRAEINLTRLFEKCELTPPLTELALYPVLGPLAEQLDAECRRLRGGDPERYPLVLTWRGFADFAVKWLCYDPDLSRETLHKRGRAFTLYFNSLLSGRPFKNFLR